MKSALAVVLALSMGIVHAEEEPEFELTTPKDYISDFPNENISVQSLDLTFSYEDIKLPGNNDMDLIVERNYKRSSYRPYVGFGINGWYPELPYITTGNNTANSITPVNFDCLGNVDSANFYVNGMKLRSLGFRSASHMPSNTIAVLSNQSIFSCENNNPVITTNDGKKMTFGTMYQQGTSTTTDKYYLVSRVEDKFGNYISYSYTNESTNIVLPRMKLTKMTRNDGVTATFNYEQGSMYEQIKSINYAGRTHTYTYTNSFLTKVTDPVGQEINYTYWDHNRPMGHMKEVTMPSGLKAEYSFYPIGGERVNNGNLKTKVISGSGVPTTTFHHEFPTYFKGDRSIQIEYLPDPTKKITREFIFNKLPAPNIGYSNGLITVANVLLEKNIYLSPVEPRVPQEYRNDPVLYSEKYAWDYKVTGQYGCRARIGSPLDAHKSCGIGYKTSKTVTVANTGGDDVYTTTYSHHDELGLPGMEVESNNFNSNERHSKTVYDNDHSNWLVGRVKYHQKSHNGGTWKTPMELTYHSSTGAYKGRLNTIKNFGVVTKSFSQYHTYGEIKTKLDANSKSFQYNNYAYGVTKDIKMPDIPTSATLEVNSDGTIKSATDPLGNKTQYQYDNIGRVTKIVYPLKSNSSYWHDKSITYSTVTSSDLAIPNSGLQSGQRKKVETKGNRQVTTYFNANLKPMLVKDVDTTDASNPRFVKIEYNRQGQITFKSNKSSTANSQVGVTTSFDHIGRAVSVTSPLGTTNIEYLFGNKKRVTDPRNNKTTISYQSFGKISQKYISKIEQPESVTTTIDRDLYGKINSITQEGTHDGSTVSSTKNYYYDNRHLMCRSYEPEIGYTAFNYDNAGNLKWKQVGTSTNYCNHTGSAPSGATKMTYDANNNLTYVDSPTGTDDYSFGYDANSNMKSSSHSGIKWAYEYNSLGTIESEALTLDGRTLKLKYEHDKLGFQSSLTYPSGRVVSKSPNAFGDDTQAGTFANSVLYHPNGKVKQFTYGNGKTYTLGLKHGHLPENISVSGIANFTYTYDAAANITDISDHLNAFETRRMTYDGLDRLKSTSGPWGAGSFEYDPLGNLTKKTIGSKTHTFNYDRTKNRLSSVSGSNSYTFSYDSQGNVSNNGRHSFTFDKSNLLTKTNSGSVASYYYDANKKRAKIVEGSKILYTFYSKAGKLLTKYEPSDSTYYDYVYLNNIQIAKVGGDEADHTIPPKPGHLTVPSTNSSGSFTVSWGAAVGATSYQLQQKIDSTGWMTIYNGSGTSKSITAPTNGTYYYQVKACNAIGCSAYLSGPRTVVTLSAPPTQAPTLSAPFSVSVNNYTVSWGAVSGAT
ncbi:MAG: hypothetical protein OQK04_20345, partial [Kangiellaceae bacterium]|nr:hypothetical protein [Kangiellaceae bacterium]